jgi:hypothetical protein
VGGIQGVVANGASDCPPVSQADCDGTVRWTAPGGQTYTTHPGSRLLFPTLCRPTAPVPAPAKLPSAQPNRGPKMPRRKSTREQNRAKRIDEQRKLNDDYVAERNKPPPF